MTLLNAPAYDATARKRTLRGLLIAFITFIVLLVAFWFAAGQPFDLPWTWPAYFSANRSVDHFLTAVESNDLQKAYAIWTHDEQWQQHQAGATYPFTRFEQDWGPNAKANEYGSIQSHQRVASKLSGNVIIVGSAINGRKSKYLFLAYDAKTHQLMFSPFELYLGA